MRLRLVAPQRLRVTNCCDCVVLSTPVLGLSLAHSDPLLLLLLLLADQ